DQHPGDEVALIDLMTPYLCGNKFYPQPHNVADDDQRQDLQESEPEHVHQGPVIDAERPCVLQAYVVAAEQQGRHQCNDHNGHRPLHVHMIPYMRSARCNLIRNKKEGSKAVIDGMQLLKAASLFKERLYLF